MWAALLTGLQLLAVDPGDELACSVIDAVIAHHLRGSSQTAEQVCFGDEFDEPSDECVELAVVRRVELQAAPFDPWNNPHSPDTVLDSADLPVILAERERRVTEAAADPELAASRAGAFLDRYRPNIEQPAGPLAEGLAETFAESAADMRPISCELDGVAIVDAFSEPASLPPGTASYQYTFAVSRPAISRDGQHALILASRHTRYAARLRDGRILPAGMAAHWGGWTWVTLERAGDGWNVVFETGIHSYN
ncbi:hypothetical protein [Glycocaulis sp.]|uniref:hypothetical protein n=1 Tax=Glycocaulis sp. TaxID=1969725 RepID=UPI003D24010F